MSGAISPLGATPCDPRAPGITNAAASHPRVDPRRSLAEPAPAKLDVPDPRDPSGALKRLAHELEGVFLNQLFQAMRASVPRDAASAPSEGEEMFTSMLDQTLAQEAARHMNHGIGDALYKQLVRRIEPGETQTR